MPAVNWLEHEWYTNFVPAHAGFAVVVLEAEGPGVGGIIMADLCGQNYALGAYNDESGL